MKRLALALLTVAVLSLAAGPALAVSDGTYDPARQGCSGSADASDAPDRTESGCHSIQTTAEDGGGHRYVDIGTSQTPDGTNVHDGTVTVDPGGESCTASGDAGVTNGAPPSTSAPSCTGSTQAGPDPSSGVGGYFGADDNLDSGEHDSSEQTSNGPSDGGGIRADLQPSSLMTWIAAFGAGDIGYLQTHPVPLLGAGAGGCADGACASAQTERRTIYQGTGKGHRDASDYEGKTWDPYTCGGPTDGKDACGGKRLGKWNGTDGAVYAEPGVQVYEDPDPQGSPLDPPYDAGATPAPTLYPLPAAYVGTCGARLGGGPAWPVPAGTPATNGAGQIGASSGC